MKTSFSSVTKCGLLVTALLSLVSAHPAQAGGANPRVLPVHASAYGRTYGEWAAAWWQWASSIPADSNPLNDNTGANAAIGQSGHVWFLAGSMVTTEAVRSIAVPKGTALFFPLANTIWVTYPTDPPMTIQEIRDTLTFVNSFITNVTCEVDGVPVNDLPNYVTQSSVFSVAVPANNLYGIDAGTYSPCVDEGMYLLLTPFPKGEHTIHFTSNHVFFGTLLDITYRISVR